jgi:hypothetical protein
MKPCEAKLPEGKPCPNQVDEGQKYCPYHLARQDADMKEILINALSGLGLGVLAANFSKIAKYVARKIL